MYIAYLIQCHKNPQQIKLFVDSLKLSVGDSVVIHVDAKCQEVRDNLLLMFEDNPNVYIMQHAIAVNWSGRTQLLATLSMLNFLQNNHIKYDYCLLLSGEDIIFDTLSLKKYLGNKNNISFVEYRDDREKYLWRINTCNIFRDNKFSQKSIVRFASSLFVRFQRVLNFRRNNFYNDEIYLGSQWFTISVKHVGILLKAISPDFLDKFKFTSCSDEHFFQILFKKHIKSDEYECHNMRFIRFSEGHNSPDYLNVDELRKIAEMPDIYIARKVSFDVLADFIMPD